MMDIFLPLWGRSAILVLAMAGASAPALAQQSGTKNVTLLGIASATVAPSGTVFGSISGSTEREGVNDSEDGSAEIGFGVGSAEDSIGFQFSAVVTSLTDDLGDSGYLSFKASRRISAGSNPLYVGLGVDQIGNWGDASDIDPTATVALTSFGRTSFGQGGETYPYMLTLGVGSNVRNNAEDAGIVFGAGIGLSRNFGLSAAWSGETVDIGTAIRIPGLENASLSATVADAFDQEDSRRLTVSVNWTVNDLFGE